MKTETIKAKRNEISTSELSAFVAPVATRGPGAHYNPAAHGNIVVRETHIPTGLWRMVAINQTHYETSSWMRTVDHSDRLASIDKTMAQLTERIGNDLRKLEAKLEVSGKSWNPAKLRKWANTGIIATGRPAYEWCEHTALAMEEHSRLEAEAKKLRAEQGDFVANVLIEIGD